MEKQLGQLMPYVNWLYTHSTITKLCHKYIVTYADKACITMFQNMLLIIHCVFEYKKNIISVNFFFFFLAVLIIHDIYTS